MRAESEALHDPVAMITGATRGHGRMLANLLQLRGFLVLGIGRSRSPWSGDEIRREATKVEWMYGDVAEPAFRARLVARVREIDRLDLLINNASELGPSPRVELDRLDLETLRRIFEVNLIAPLALTHQLRPYLVRARGMVVNISSDAAVGGYPGWGGYGSSKAALDLATKTLSAESGTDGITFVSVDPGDMRTEMHQAAFPGEDISDRPLPEVTGPFWSWLLAHSADQLNGARFQAQAETWEIPTPGS
jgi:NAD(P)-dependent dehydrogenase (short-subunit alcohol dehydrogenase family)